MTQLKEPALVYSLLVRLLEDVDRTAPGTECLLMDSFNLLAAHHTPTALVALPERSYDEALADAHAALSALAAAQQDLAVKLDLLNAARLLGDARTRCEHRPDHAR